MTTPIKKKRSTSIRPQEVAIYFGSNIWKSSEYLFAQTLGFELVSALAKVDTPARIFADYRPEKESGQPLPELVQAVESGAVSGVVCPILTAREYGWIHELPVPLAMVTGGCAGPEVLNISMRRSLMKAFLHAGEAGARSVGLISHRKRGKTGIPPGELESTLLACAKACGLEVREQWMEFGGKHPDESLGFSTFETFWKRRPRPDVILVDTDILSRGVVTAVLSMGIRVPQDLKLILHRNDLLPYPCPFPATFLETPVARCARSLLRILEEQTRGTPLRRRVVEMGVCLPPGTAR